VPAVINLVCPTEVCIDRIMGRGQGRDDDQLEIAQKRVQVHETETCPIIELYRAQGKIVDIDTNRPLETVYPELLNVFP
jgi:adenylate kinase family enzyme